MVARLEAAVAVHNVKWSVNDVIGGSTEFETNDANILHRAPRKTLCRARFISVRKSKESETGIFGQR
jgi:hypothetical protein